MRTHRIASVAAVAALAFAGTACAADTYDSLSPGQEAPADDDLGGVDGGVDGGEELGGTDSDTEGGAVSPGGQ
jgi:hypothetical protein